jgi:cytochrome c oxidase subunit 2
MMAAEVVVETKEKHEEFLAAFSKMPKLCGTPPVECTEEKWGEGLFAGKGGCIACHGMAGDGMLGGAPSPGPKLAGIFGKPQPLADGTNVEADENYIRESILDPNQKIVAGYTNVQMPSFRTNFTDDQVEAVIAYIKSLK